MKDFSKKKEYEVIKKASFSTKQVIETVASNVGKSKFISLLVQRIINNCYIKQRPLHLH